MEGIGSKLGHWLSIVNGGLLLAAGGLVATGALWRGEEAHQAGVRVELKLPPNSFQAESYRELGTPFALKHTPPAIRLPDLRGELTFYGLNERPDASRDRSVVHLGIDGSEEIVGAVSGEERYIEFDPSSEDGPYHFSPENRPTKLWVMPDVDKETVRFSVGMRTEEGKLVSEPAEHAQFSLRQRSLGRRSSWQIGGMRVDNSLLARQRARWIGEDRFLADHGGEEFEHAAGRERIDFGEGDAHYSCFLKPGESLVWRGERWERPKEGENTLGLPLLHMRKFDERLMLLDLWDETGKARVSLSLMHSKGGSGPNRHAHLRFVAARTWSQFVLEFGAERVEVAPGDWLLFDDKKLRKLTQVEEIDAYVNQKLTGELMVIDGLLRKEGRQRLVCHLYDPTRTQVSAIEIPLLSEAGPVRAPTRAKVEESEEIEEDPLLALPRVIRGMIEEINE